MKLKKTKLSYKQQLVRVGKRLCLSTLIFLTIPTSLVKAQITLDESLPTSVEQQEENRLNINGGEREGNNLFHSFEEFSVREGIEATFENATDIENIFTRITGESASTINGILRTQGGANFFLINPNGIAFGKNAQLNVGGAFIATTADSVQFEDGAEFIASNIEEKPILTVSVPVGLNFEDNDAGAIIVNGNASQITPNAFLTSTSVKESTSKLALNSKQTLALIGGDISIKSGTITTQSGQIFLISIQSGSISFKNLNSGWILDTEKISGYKNINLSQQTLIKAEDNESIVQIIGKNINLINGSAILFQDRGNVSSRNLIVDATESFTLSGTANYGDISSFIRTEALGNGNGASINISAKDLILEDGAAIGTVTYGRGRAGDLTIDNNRSLQLLDNSSVNLFRQGFITSSISSVTYGLGNGGDVNISAQQLKNTDGGTIAASTFGVAEGGNINIKADLVEVEGIEPQRYAPTEISASTSGSGSAGNVNLSTQKLFIRNGASVNSSSFAGNGGDVIINADLIEITGEAFNSKSDISAAVIIPNEVVSNIFRISTPPTGNAGNVIISSQDLNIGQSGQIGVANHGSGDAGLININTKNLDLVNSASILATTISGNGGNIHLGTENLQIDSGSVITATANNNGKGGNIIIDTTSLIAKRNSEVIANASNGEGGRINIDAKGLFLFDSPENIFSASSELGIDGTVQINTPDINVQRELEQSELELLTAEQAIANSCLARSNQQGSFTINDNGGLPKNPNSNYSDAGFSLTGMSRLPTTTRQPSEIPENSRHQNSSAIPAQKMIETESGRIFLVAAPQKAESLYCQSIEGQEK